MKRLDVKLQAQSLFAQDGETAIKKSFEVESKVFVFKVEEGALMEITPFPFKKRIS